jgi:superfamily I DNA/RNA helicase
MVVAVKEIKEFSEKIGISMRGYSADTDDSLELGDEYAAVITYANASMMPMPWAYKEKGMPGSFNEFMYFHDNYKHWKSSYGFVDFDDMLELAIKADVPHDYPVLLIDESQDLSKSQWKLINKMSQNTKEITIVGDPDQSLFVWGGAWPYGMIDWAKKHKAKITELSQSYRVPLEPYKISRDIISMVKNRYEKDYKPTGQVGSVDKFGSLNRFNFKNLKSGLILYRSHALRKAIENELIYANKAYTTLNGSPGLCQNKYGQGVRAWMRIKESDFPDKNDINHVKKIASPTLLKAIGANDLENIKRMNGSQALLILPHLMGYYRNVDFSTVDTIQLSTIHGAKGMENENVIILNGLTQRIMEGATKDPDSEWLVWYVATTRTKNKLNIIDGEGVASPL